jgi:hypothetical protein
MYLQPVVYIRMRWPAVVKSEWELLETCRAFNERWNNKFYYKLASCWLFLLRHLTQVVNTLLSTIFPKCLLSSYHSVATDFGGDNHTLTFTTSLWFGIVRWIQRKTWALTLPQSTGPLSVVLIYKNCMYVKHMKENGRIYVLCCRPEWVCKMVNLSSHYSIVYEVFSNKLQI